MKKFIMAVVAVLLMFPTAGFSFDLSEVTYGVFGGFIFPDDAETPYGDVGLDMGFTIGGQALMPSGMNDELSFGVQLAYSMTSGDKTFFGTKYDLDVKIIEIFPIARYNLDFEAGDMSFFCQAGLGFGNIDAEVSTSTGSGSDDETEFGFGFGGGVKVTENIEVVAMYKDFDGSFFSLTVGYNFGD